MGHTTHDGAAVGYDRNLIQANGATFVMTSSTAVFQNSIGNAIQHADSTEGQQLLLGGIYAESRYIVFTPLVDPHFGHARLSLG